MSLQQEMIIQGRPAKVAKPHFVVAVVILLAAAILIGPVAWSMNFQQGKEAIPLRKPLSAMEVDRLMPYRVIERVTLDAPILDALGTDQYINWRIQDTSLPPGDPLYEALLFVTYETGGQNLVPHVPDECRLGAGYQAAQQHENRQIRVEGELDREVPLRVCTFVKTAVFHKNEVSVVYLFHANGEFAGTREQVRIAFNDPRDRFAYFSKIEISFPRASREQNVEGGARLLGKLLPVLISDHLPEFEKAELSTQH